VDGVLAILVGAEVIMTATKRWLAAPKHRGNLHNVIGKVSVRTRPPDTVSLREMQSLPPPSPPTGLNAVAFPVSAADLCARVFFAAVWTVNGLWCKLLNGVPRHQEIVGRILGEEHALFFTRLIGTGEILFALWILSGIQRRWSAITQIAIVLLMNVIEFKLAPDLLLFGRANFLVALAYVSLVAMVEFRKTPRPR
jgi:uncharacterized membrane protein YphA (DoxX/SURF4 family)